MSRAARFLSSSFLLAFVLYPMGGVMAQAGLAASNGSAHARVKGVILNTRQIPSCQQVGRCKAGERRWVVPTANTAPVREAIKKGCVVGSLFRGGVSLRCPSTVSVPNARTERIFQVADLLADEQMGVATVQQEGVTGDGVRVAVLDTGVDTDHPELAGKVVLQRNFTTDALADGLGHGTHVSGIIAGQGVQEMSDGTRTDRALGVSPGVQLIVGKVCGNDGYCTEADVMAGIDWAVTQKAQVINLSLGGAGFLTNCDDDPVAQEVNWAVSKGAVVVAAAGNAGTEGIATPACASQAIAVGAVDADDVRPSWSSYGMPLDLVAPGLNILSPISCLSAGTCPTPSYGWWSGTSMATPQVTGVAALVLQQQPSLTPQQVRTVLFDTAKDLGDPGFDPYYGHGRVDALAAVQSLTGGSSSSSSESSTSSQQSSSSSAVSSSEESSSVGQSSSASSEGQRSSRASARSRSSRDDGEHEWSSHSDAGQHRGEDHKDSSRSSKEPPACTPAAWLCDDFSDCLNGQQERKCELVNEHCRAADLVRPPSSRKCPGAVPPDASSATSSRRGPPPPPHDGSEDGSSSHQGGSDQQGKSWWKFWGH